ncbi:glycosyltransferase family 2 protein [Weeksella sp. HMSC059D05]|uniref:glycosyltransferase family 2 protein n=1 Tax=Weeksella sp. HMSC059D05 TaxID=1715139 RepID=UPI0008A12974|nr:glycosyltransferase family 2 protein [Weeksella sp. HMSC059D05]OFM81826.1 hypothetical protein HMPREF2660_05595 [Weeksella sp. HMSC059D05]
MKVFAIIVIYNGMRRDWIQKCFDSLQNSSIAVNIIAVDNNSTDNSVEYIKKNYPSVILIENKENKGFGGANNQGLKIALENGGEYFFLLNQDATVEANTVEVLQNVLIQNNEYGIVSPIHLNGSGDKIDYLFSKCLVPSETPNFLSDLYLNKLKDVYTGRANAAAWLMTKKCLEIVGGFNPVFFHYGEDSNYLHRLWYKKLKLGVVPNTRIFHDREYREESSYDHKDEQNRRMKLLYLSNPNRNSNIDKEIKKLKISMFKYYFLDKTYYKTIKEEYLFLVNQKDKIFLNNTKVKSNTNYLFINE